MNKKQTLGERYISRTDNPLKACSTLLSDMFDSGVLQLDGAVTALSQTTSPLVDSLF